MQPSDCFLPSPRILIHQELRLTVQTTSDWLTRLVDQHARIIVKLDDAPVRPLTFLHCPHNDRMSDVASPYFVGCGNGNGTAGAGLGTKRALLLNDHDDSITWDGL